MASDRIFRALDQLAGTAAQEIDKAKDFQVQQNLRLDALARLSQKEQQEFAHQEEQLDFRKDQLKQAAALHKVTEDRLTSEFGEKQGSLSKQTKALNDLKEAEIKAGITKSNIAAQAGIRRTNGQLLLSAEEQLSEAQQAGLTDQEMLPFFEKVRRAETAVYGSPITPLPQPEEDRPQEDLVVDEGKQAEEGDGFLKSIADFILNTEEGTFFGAPVTREALGRERDKNKQKRALRELRSKPEFTTLERTQ